MPNLGGFLEAIGDFPTAPDAASTAPTSPLASPTDSPRIMKLFWKVSYCGKHSVPVFLRLTLSVQRILRQIYWAVVLISSDLRPYGQVPQLSIQQPLWSHDSAKSKRRNRTKLLWAFSTGDQPWPDEQCKNLQHPTTINNHEKLSIKDDQESSTTIKNHQEPSMIINNYQAPSTINKPQPWGCFGHCSSKLRGIPVGDLCWTLVQSSWLGQMLSDWKKTCSTKLSDCLTKVR